MKDLIERIWWNRREDRASGAVYVLRLLLIPCALLYSGVATLRNLLFDVGILTPRHAARPTISVGNITVGGTGKTPFVETLARDLASEGKRVAIVSRGYGNGTEEDDETLSPSDEGQSIRRWTDPNRLEAARRAMQRTSPDLFLMDDGFQHRQMARDLDIVLVDGLRVFGNGYPLPAGPLREPVAQIRRADLVVITRANRLDRDEVRTLREELDRYLSEDIPILEAAHRPRRVVRWNTGDEWSRDILGDSRLLAFCGIGTPDSFRHTLRDDLDLEPVAFRTFPDHHRYSENDRSELISCAEEQDADYLITTRKDAVKWPEDPPIPLLYVDVEVQVTRGKRILKQNIRRILESERGTDGITPNKSNAG